MMMNTPKEYTLYYFESCPYCQKVLRALESLQITIAMKDTKLDPIAKNELLQGGGKTQVPCLKISQPENIKWLYESDAIIEYLREI